MYGHIEIMAGAIAEGARSVEGVDVTVKRVPELMSAEVAAKYGAKLDQSAPIASPDELPDYDAIIFGTPTRFGNMAAQMRNFLDQTGKHWMQGCAHRQGRERFCKHRHWGRKRIDHSHFHPNPLAPWHDLRRTALRLSRAHGHQRIEGRVSLRRGDDCRTRRLANAERQRTRHGPLSRKTRCRHRRATPEVAVASRISAIKVASHLQRVDGAFGRQDAGKDCEAGHFPETEFGVGVSPEEGQQRCARQSVDASDSNMWMKRS